MFDRLRATAFVTPIILMLAVPAGAQTPAPAAKPVVEKPNPAAKNCSKLGGTSQITVSKRGQEWGWCKLPDGKVCEEWALLQDKICIEQKTK